LRQFAKNANFLTHKRWNTRCVPPIELTTDEEQVVEELNDEEEEEGEIVPTTATTVTSPAKASALNNVVTQTLVDISKSTDIISPQAEQGEENFIMDDIQEQELNEKHALTKSKTLTDLLSCGGKDDILSENNSTLVIKDGPIDKLKAPIVVTEQASSPPSLSDNPASLIGGNPGRIAPVRNGSINASDSHPVHFFCRHFWC
jgi:hypothetical protein